MPSERSKKKEGRLARHVRVARQIREEPRSAVGFLRGWLLDLWISRGGGFYGLGFVIAFVILEIQTLFGDIVESEGVTDFVMQESMEFVFRIGYESLVNFVLALLWPVYILSRYEVWALVFLAAGYYGFEYLLRPLVESRLPELKAARIALEEEARAKKEQKAARRAAKKERSERWWPF